MTNTDNVHMQVQKIFPQNTQGALPFLGSWNNSTSVNSMSSTTLHMRGGLNPWLSFSDLSQKHWVTSEKVLHSLLIICIYFPQPLQLFLWHLVQLVPLLSLTITNTLLLIFSAPAKSREYLRATGITSPPSTLQTYNWNRNLEPKLRNSQL